jgi:hypothetical protein
MRAIDVYEVKVISLVRDQQSGEFDIAESFVARYHNRIRRISRGEFHVADESGFDRIHIGFDEAVCLVFHPAFPCIDTVYFQWEKLAQHFNQVAGALTFVRPHLKDFRGLYLRYQLIPDTSHVGKSIIGELKFRHALSL